MSFHAVCVFVGLCNPPAPPVVEVVKPGTFTEYWHRKGFHEPTAEEPDGRIPLDWIFEYDPLTGELPTWWHERDFYRYPRQKDFNKI